MGRHDGRAPGRLGRIPARGLVATGIVSVQFGAALAADLFSRIGPTGTVSLRVAFAALVLGVACFRRGWWAGAGHGRRDLVVVVAFGVVLAAMNLSFYAAIARIPLGVGVTMEFAGPLAVSLFASRRRSDLLWAALAAGGVVLLAGHVGHHLDPVGVGLALLAGAFWAAYILLSAETGRRFPGASGLALSLVVGSVLLLPVGVAHAGRHLLEPGVLAMGAAVAVLSSVLPYSLEMSALRRLTPRAFGILMSGEPAVAALAGLLVLGQHLSLLEVGALVLVMGANVGSTLADRASTVRPGGVPEGNALATRSGRADGKRRPVATVVREARSNVPGGDVEVAP